MTPTFFIGHALDNPVIGLPASIIKSPWSFNQGLFELYEASSKIESEVRCYLLLSSR